MLTDFLRSRLVKTERKVENKQEICNRLAYALMATRSFHDLAYLEYDPKTETVKAVFNSGHAKTANVCMDSGSAMILDIIKQIQ